MKIEHTAEEGMASVQLSTDELLNGLPYDLTLRFFSTFARFEFALKHCDCLKRVEGVAEACRRKLELRLSPDFFDAIRESGIAETLISRPARNLRVRRGAVPRFGDPEAPLEATGQLLDAVWRVRNNLFHGNKLYPADRNRDTALMTDALAVIYAILERDQQLSSVFYEPQQYF